MKYRKIRKAPAMPLMMDSHVLGMLYIVSVRFEDVKTREITKQRMLMVGCEIGDIEKKLRWIYEADKYTQFSVTEIEKVREKIHVLSTSITQPSDKPKNTILREDGRNQPVTEPTPDLPDLIHYAVGVSTRVYARDQYHALRKVSAALHEQGTEGPSSCSARLSPDSTVLIEEIAKPAKFARARDTSHETVKAHIVRG